MLKKLKKVVVFFLCTLMIFSIPAGPALAGPPASLEEAKAAANQELLEKFGVPDYFTDTNISGKPLRRHELAEPGYGYYVLTWGDPHGDIKNGHRRYVGYTYNDEDFTNPTFPHDAWAGGKLEDRNWIKRPWDNKELQQKYNIVPNNFDGSPKLLWHIQAGLIIKYSDVSLLAQSPMWEHWHEYVHIMVPPTQYSWGMGRMWHKRSDGSIWYISIPLAPKALDTEKPDFSVTLDKHQVQAKTGDTIEFVATFALNADHPRAETAKLTAFHVVGSSQFQVTLEPLGPADKLNSDGTIGFQPGEQKKYRVRVTAQGQNSKVVVKINPWSVAYDANWANNSDEALIMLELPNNLSVQITNYPEEVYSGDPIPVTALVRNTSGKYVMTDFRWKVDGAVVREYNNFDLVTSQGTTYTMTAPKVDEPRLITFTAEVNYNHNRPPDEASWDDNTATVMVKVLPHKEAVSGDLNMWIEAPSFVNNSPLPKPWTFTVWVKPPYIPEPPPPPPDADPPPPPVLTVKVTTAGGLRGDKYEYSTGQQNIVPVEPTFSDSTTVPYEDETPIPFTFTFPWSGVWGQKTLVHIHASGHLTAWCGEWSGEAGKDVTIGEIPIPGKKQILTK
nr:hypothetical protein [Desulfofundulus sp. TPOSR]